MTKLARLFCCVLSAALLCSACGQKTASTVPAASASDISEPDASEPTSPEPIGPETTDPEERFMSHAIPLELPEGDIPDGTVVPYTWDYSVTVDDDRQFILRLRCEAEYWYMWHYGARYIDMLEEGSDHYLDRLSIHAADAVAEYQTGYDIDWAMETTDHRTEDCGLIIEDLNFDGIPDLRLPAATGVVNTNYLCWLWEPENRRFEYSFSLHGYDVRLDPEKKQIVTEDRDAQTYTTKYYRYDKNGKLYLADSKSVTY